MSRKLAILLIVCCLTGASAIEIRGTVRDGADTPVANAQVWVLQQWQPSVTTTDKEGKFVLDGLSADSVDIVAWKEGYGLDGITAPLLGDVDIVLHLPAAQTVTLDLTDDQLQPLTGVYLKTLTVNDRFQVQLRDLKPLGFPVVRSDSHGQLVIPFVPEGGYVSPILEAPDFVDLRLPYLPAGRTLTVPMHRGVAVRGRVLTPDGKGVSEARVSLFRRLETGPTVFADTVADSEGYYHLTAEPGDYNLAAFHPDWGGTPPREITVSDENENVEDMHFDVSRTLSGRITGTNGEAAGGGIVRFQGENGVEETAFVDANGQFTVRTTSASGVLQIVPPKGYVNAQLPESTVDFGDKTNVRFEKPFTVKPLPLINGVVHDKDGQVAQNALVSVLNYPEYLWCLTDTKGAFTLQLPTAPDSGTVTLAIEHARRFMATRQTIDVANSASLNFTLADYDPQPAPNRPDAAPNNLEHMVGHKASSISCSQWYNADNFSVKTLDGKVAVITFWSGFQIDEAGLRQVEQLRALHALFKEAEDVVVLGIFDAVSEEQRLQAYAQHFGPGFPIGRDAEPYQTFEAFGIRTVPQTVIIDKRGHFRFYDVEGRLVPLVKALRREDSE